MNNIKLTKNIIHWSLSVAIVTSGMSPWTISRAHAESQGQASLTVGSDQQSAALQQNTAISKASELIVDTQSWLVKKMKILANYTRTLSGKIGEHSEKLAESLQLMLNQLMQNSTYQAFHNSVDQIKSKYNDAKIQIEVEIKNISELDSQILTELATKGSVLANDGKLYMNKLFLQNYSQMVKHLDSSSKSLEVLAESISQSQVIVLTSDVLAELQTQIKNIPNTASLTASQLSNLFKGYLIEAKLRLFDAEDKLKTGIQDRSAVVLKTKQELVKGIKLDEQAIDNLNLAGMVSLVVVGGVMEIFFAPVLAAGIITFKAADMVLTCKLNAKTTKETTACIKGKVVEKFNKKIQQ